MNRLLSILLALSAVVVLAAPGRAVAQRGRSSDDEGSAPTPTVRDVDEIAARLESSDPDEVREAIDLLSVIDHPSVIPPLTELLRSGRSDEVTDRALMALRGLGHPSAIDVLVEFTHHRRARARRLAYQGLAAIDDRRIPELLEQGLRDSDRNIRAAAARALGDIGARRSVDTLFLAFDRGVVEAAIAIGKLGNRGTVEQFTEYLGDVPLSVMLSGYHEYVRRDDIPDEVKMEIVNRLGEVSGPMVRQFLQRYLDTFPTRGRASRSRLRQNVVDTLRRIPGHAGSARGRVVSTDSAEAEEGDEE
ncbi:MAG TPA: HEAT repeat domain-containing protein [Sandaracinaceae bacterium LLY-WYZ-13_1]|nr:HEAT repeat domain-containing protein [Sandaracinaceae bacterium LLY-WYZ-13_1]